MRRTLVVLLAACWLTLVLSATAWAQSYPPSGPTSPVVDAASGQDGTAFSGGDLVVATIAGLVFIGVAVVTLVVARRRADRLVGSLASDRSAIWTKVPADRPFDR